MREEETGRDIHIEGVGQTERDRQTDRESQRQRRQATDGSGEGQAKRNARKTTEEKEHAALQTLLKAGTRSLSTAQIDDNDAVVLADPVSVLAQEERRECEEGRWRNRKERGGGGVGWTVELPPAFIL